MREPDDAADDGVVVAVGAHARHEAAVHLERPDGVARELLQRAVPGPEVVERDARAESGQVVQGGAGAARHGRLGAVDDQP
ncbi:MAG TPA: hypothetical protein VNU26_01405, partial [Mycobacteriales bacterium]|nr:hypothetical protein [Mycobacteriales bacterium]